MNVNENIEKELRETLLIKKGLFEEILDISELQSKWILKDDWKRLMNCIDTKQDKINKVNRVNQILKQLAPNHKLYQCKESKLLVEEINGIICKIQAKEKVNISMTQEKMNNDKVKLKDVTLKKTVNTAYSNIKGIQKDGCFIDKFK